MIRMVIVPIGKVESLSLVVMQQSVQSVVGAEKEKQKISYRVTELWMDGRTDGHILL